VRIWLGVVVVALVSAMFKAVGPAALGKRQLPPLVRLGIALLPSVVLAALIVSSVVGPRWTTLDAATPAGLAAAATAWALKAPMIGAVIAAVLASAAVRLIT
jgi:branched chain amino acid efflux pump